MLKFDEEKHEYTLNGKILISVTQLMQKHGLAPSYAGVSTEVLKAKAERGTMIHEEIEHFNKTGEIGFTTELFEFIKYIEENNVEVLESELKLYNDIVAGTCDLILCRNEKQTIADIKTTYTLHTEAVSWQLSIYAYLYWNNHDGNSELAKLDYNTMSGQAFHFNNEKELTVVDIPLKPYDEIEKLMECERNGELYNQELTVHDKILLKELAQAESLIKRIEDEKKQAEEEAKRLREHLLNEMEKRSIKVFENENIKLTYVAPSKRITLDSKGIKEKYPDIYEEFSKETEIKASVRITLKEQK